MNSCNRDWAPTGANPIVVTSECGGVKKGQRMSGAIARPGWRQPAFTQLSRSLAKLISYPANPKCRLENFTQADPSADVATEAQGATDSSSAVRAVAAFAALGQPTRLAILRLLVGHEPCGMSVGDIAQSLNCPQNTTSGHLAILARAQLVHGERKGRSVAYCADLAGVRWLVDYLLADCCHGDPAACASVLADICSGDCAPTSKSRA